MDDLEVAFQGDDHETDLLCLQSNYHQSCGFKDDANCAVENPVTVVVEAVCKHHDVEGYSKNRGVEVHRGLVDDQGMGGTAELPTRADQNYKDHAVSNDTNAADDEAYCCDNLW